MIPLSVCCSAIAERVCGLWLCSNCLDGCAVKPIEDEDQPDPGPDDANDRGIPRIGE